MNWKTFNKIIFVFFVSFQLLAQPLVGDEVEISGKTALRYFNGTSFKNSELIGVLKRGDKRVILEVKPWKHTDGSNAYILRVGSIVKGVEVSDGEIFYREGSEFVKLIAVAKSKSPVPLPEAKYVEALAEIELYDQLGKPSAIAQIAKGERLNLVNDLKFYPLNPNSPWMHVQFPKSEESYYISKDNFPKVIIQTVKKQIEDLKQVDALVEHHCPLGEQAPAKEKVSPANTRFNPKVLRGSKNLLNIIRIAEGCFLRPYICPAGYRTIGCGHRCDDECPNIITSDKMEQLLSEDVLKFEQVVRDEFKNVTLTQGQFDALVSIAFNLGNRFSPRKDCRFARLIDETLAPNKNPTASELLKICGEISRYQYSRTDPIKGLRRRRVVESVLFMNDEFISELNGATGFTDEHDKILRPYYEKMQSTIPEKFKIEYNRK